MPSPRGLAMVAEAVPALPGHDDVLAAAERLRGVAHRTPVLTSRTLSAAVGADVFFKCESFQRGGAFKFRGAYNAMSQLDASSREAGVVAYSSGNHAQAVALTGRLLGIRTTIVMPADAPVAKLDATHGYGAEVVTYDPRGEDRQEIAERIRSERGATIVPPYDHPHIVAGQGTAALELIEEQPLDLLLVPCGGGGLLSGSALALVGRGCRVVGVEPELADDAARTFRSGTIQRVKNPPTIADGLRTPSLGAVTWPLIREHVHDIVTVTEEAIVEAMGFYWSRMKLVVEPSGAVSLAALRAHPELRRSKRIGVMISGGNVDAALACSVLT